MRLGLATAISIFSVGFGASVASAQLDNPDVLDVDSTFLSESPKGASQNGADIRQSGSENTASGFVDNFGTNGGSSTSIQISWHMYEPDKVKRDSKSAKLSQKSWVAIDFGTWMWTGSTWVNTWASTVVEKCKAKTQVSGTEGVPTDASWKVSCKGALAALAEVSGIGETHLEKLSRLLSDYVNVGKDKLNVKGKGPVD